MSTGHANVIAIYSSNGGVGRTNTALALALAARGAGIPAAIVDASLDADATRLVEYLILDVTVVDVTGTSHTTEQRLHAVDRARQDVDLVIVDAATGSWDTQFIDRLAADGAHLLGIADPSTVTISGFLSRNKALSETVPVERRGFLLNKIPTDGTFPIDKVMAAVAKETGFQAVAERCDTPRMARGPEMAALGALAPAAQQTLDWLGLPAVAGETP